MLMLVIAIATVLKISIIVFDHLVTLIVNLFVAEITGWL